MTIFSIGSPASSLDRLQGPDGVPARADMSQQITSLWYPNRLVPGGEFDTQAVLDPRDELTVLGEGGALFGNANEYFNPASVRATLLAGRLRKAVQAVNPAGVYLIPLDGLIGTDQFTIEATVKAIGVDFSTLTNATVWATLNGHLNSSQTLALTVNSGTVTVTLALNETAMAGGGAHTLSASITFANGDLPADTWGVISVTWDGDKLRVYFNDAAKSGVSSSIGTSWYKRPFSGSARKGGGLAIGADRANGLATKALAVSDLQVHRYARTPAQMVKAAQRGLAIDASSTVEAWEGKLAGVVAHYTGWARNETGESSYTTQRAAQIQALRDAGGRVVRIAEFNERAVPTVSGGAIQGIDYTGLDAHWDRLLTGTGGATSVLMHIGYTPTAFGGTSSANNPPTAAATGAATEAAAFTLYASYVSQVLSHLKARYPGVIKSISFWNEPELSGFWNGTLTQFKALWLACAQKIQTDHPDLPALGTPDCSDAAGSYMTGIIDHAATNSLPLASAHYHDYNGEIHEVLEMGKQVRAYLDSKGFTATPVRLTEFAIKIGAGEAGGGSAAGAQGGGQLERISNTTRAAAWQHTLLAHIARDIEGVGWDAATVFRLGRQETFDATQSTEEYFGLLENDTLPRPTPLFGMYELLWKHSGNRVTTTPNWPDVHAIATKSSADVITVTYSSYRSHRSHDVRPVQFSWAGLPSTFTWQMWRLDYRDEGDGRPVLLSSGDQTNLPAATDLTSVGMGAVQITP